MNVLLLLMGAAIASLDGGVNGGMDSGPPILEPRSVDGGPPDVPSIQSMDGQNDAVVVHKPDTAPSTRWVGRVLAKGSRGPIEAAKIAAISAKGQDVAAQTDEDGHFELAVPCGWLELVVSAPGFEPWVDHRDACAVPSPLVVRLVPRSDLPVYETVVTAKPEEPSVGLRGSELVATPGALGDPLRVIESLPGVASVAWPAPIYAVRGSNPGNTGYFLDGIQLPLLFHLALGPAAIHPYFLDSMSFYPGGYPAQYGRYVGGIVAAQTRAGSTDRVHASAEIRLYDAGAFVTVPFSDENGAVAAAFRYSYAGALLSLLSNDLKLSYWDYQLRADRRVGRWRLTLLLLGSDDDLVTHGNPLNSRQEVAMVFHRASLRADRPLGAGRLNLRLTLGLDKNGAPLLENTPGRQSASSVAPRASYEWHTEIADYELGLDGQAQWLRSSNDANEIGVSDLARNRTAWLLGAYASSTLHAGQRLTLTPGLRFDSYTIGGITKTDWGPRLSARLLLGLGTWLSASGGRFSQTPSVGAQIPAGENFGLGLYGLQTSWQGALGVGTEWAPAFEVEVTGFAQRSVLTDLRNPGINQPDPLATDLLVRRDARAYGMEVMIRRPATQRLHGWISYTLSKSERAFGGGVIGPSDWDQRHVLNAVLGYRAGPYTFGARGHYNTGRPVLVSGDQVESFVRLPAFHQLDLRAERRILFNSFTLNVYLELVNATLTRSVYELQQLPTGEIAQHGFRVFLPSIGVRGEL